MQLVPPPVEIIDDDTMLTASATNVPSAESVVAYVSAQVGAPTASYVGRVHQTLTDKTSFSGTSAEQWGAEEAVFDNAGLPNPTGVIVYANVIGTALNTTNTTNTLILIVEISLDGGSTWSTGVEHLVVRDASGSATGNTRTIAAQHQHTGNVTGDIQARVMAKCSAGASTAYDLLNGSIGMEVVSNP